MGQRRRRRNPGRGQDPTPGGSEQQQTTGELLELGGEEDLLEFEGASQLKANIKVVGVGGGGGNAINTMIDSGLSGVEFVAANTDAQALEYNRAGLKMQLGTEVTRGLGCGANPDKGRSSALEVRDRIHDQLAGADMVFVTAGLGGGTGTGAAPVVAEIAREVGALTVAVVTKPFGFEGKVRGRHADHGLDELHDVVDTLITIPNDRLLKLAGKSTAMRDAFRLADEVLLNAVKGIADLITVHGLVNLDFADVRTIMNEMGMALMGTGIANGDERAAEAARMAISSPLLEDLSIEGARGVLINISGGEDLTLFEVNEASMVIQEAAHEEANIIFGAVIDDDIPEGEVRVTVIATGLDDDRPRRGIDRTERGRVTESARLVEMPRREAPAPAPAMTAEQVAELPIEGEPRRSEPTAEAWPAVDSPFEDELDVPTFLRNRGRAAIDEEDEEAFEDPAFLRRSAD
jgi:cell division protein FtsZ